MTTRALPGLLTAACLLMLTSGCGQQDSTTPATPPASGPATTPATTEAPAQPTTASEVVESTSQSSSDTTPVDTTYIPEPVFCADGSDSPCGVMPSMIGPDPAIESSPLGYHGLGPDVANFNADSQTPFDNMAWQMFAAANWRDGVAVDDPQQGLDGKGATLWSGWARPQDVFGAEPETCANPDNLPRFSIISKGGGQPDSRMGGFLQAATAKPLIDATGNWVVFERRLNPTEVDYLNAKGLTTVAGQQTFIDNSGTVAFTPGEDKPDGNVGAIEIKTAWRILPADQDPTNYYVMPALLDVSADMVADSDNPICETVNLAMVGMHIMQKNPAKGALKDQWIWATFEHVDNAPLAAAPADPVDVDSYQIANSNCPADDTGKSYSLYNADCSDCTVNGAPDKGDDASYLWNATQPYAARYLNDGKYGTQVVQCAKPYYLTAEVDAMWREKMGELNSVFANYTLVGTQWGGKIEPVPGEFWRNAVPDFLSNTTMETYIQTDIFKFDEHGQMTQGPGSCIGCHDFATLAADHKTKADFSFLPGLAQGHASATDASQ